MKKLMERPEKKFSWIAERGKPRVRHYRSDRRKIVSSDVEIGGRQGWRKSRAGKTKGWKRGPFGEPKAGGAAHSKTTSRRTQRGKKSQEQRNRKKGAPSTEKRPFLKKKEGKKSTGHQERGNDRTAIRFKNQKHREKKLRTLDGKQNHSEISGVKKRKKK